MRSRLLYVIAVLALVDVGLLAYSVFKGPYPGVVPLGDPTAYRNIYIHVPIAVTSYLLFATAMVLAAIYLKTGRDLEGVAHSFILVGLAYSMATLTTGSIWASESWGSPWNWDPRESGVLLMFAAYTVYLVIRYSIKDPAKRSRVSMAYAILAFTTVPVSFALPYLAPSLHPVTSDTASFLEGRAASLFGARMLVVVVASFLLALAVSRRVELWKALAIPLVAGLAIAGYGLASYMGGETGVVVNATIQDGVLEATVFRSGAEECITYKGPSPIEPAVLELPDGSLQPSIIGHTILYKGGSSGSCMAVEELRVLNHWGVYVNILLYVILVYGGTLLLSRRLGG